MIYFYILYLNGFWKIDFEINLYRPWKLLRSALIFYLFFAVSHNLLIFCSSGQIRAEIIDIHSIQSTINR